jgi:hypothetical protein
MMGPMMGCPGKYLKGFIPGKGLPSSSMQGTMYSVELGRPPA